jgi:transcriptional regulator with XRE-family HTH domain
MGAARVDIARTLRERRRALGLTRARLADQTGLTAVDLSKWERGEDVPAPEAVIVLAEAIGLEVDETQEWLDEVTIDLTGPEVSVELLATDEAPSDPFSMRATPLREDSGLLGKIAGRLARRDDRTGIEDASVAPIRTPVPAGPARVPSAGLAQAPGRPRQATQLPSVFPDPAFAPYDPAVHVYSSGPIPSPTEDEEQMYILRRIRTTATLIGLGLLLWWAMGGLWEGLGDAIDLFRSPVPGG